LARPPCVRCLLLAVLALAGVTGAWTAPSGASCGMASPAPSPALAEALRPRGAPLLVHVWAIWCRPCVAEWPALAGFLRGLEGRRIRLVILSLDDETRAADSARVLGRAGAPGCPLRAGSEAAAPVLRGLDPEWDGELPSTFVLDADGRLVLAQRGATDTAGLREVLDRMAPPKPAPAATRGGHKKEEGHE